jgi:hypothetical protein
VTVCQSHAHSGARALLLHGVDGREDGAGYLVCAAQQPVGEGQELTSGFAQERCEQQGTANEDQPLHRW